ncbi:tyrosine-type recombinase/integrase [Arcobacter lanthieri]|uniref:tyrosine-type recombinase/integrase n=1 Tax=Aliarcobacter lanthieri TaxID=1355374 RepID=UPI0019240368|nr:integrase arm-type DNA-binding domain-containing protein [Aliarcobacter lanthieri]MBL3518900.1 tyrosine-type recombinase/integrase [Aliarcobacter lanthieri]
MARIVKPLTDTEIKTSKVKEKEYKLSDGLGLYLVVKTNGTKYFRFDFSYANKRKSMSFGIYPQTSLKEARELREKAREQLKNNINPIESKKSNFEDITTFEYIANKWFTLMKSEWKDVTYELNENRLKLHVFPYIGDKNIKSLERLDILNIIQKLQEKEHFEIAQRILNVIERIYKYSVTYGYVEHNIIADIDKKSIFAKKIVTHRAAITKENEIRELIKDIKNYGEFYRADISTIYALNIAPYLALRPYNLRNLEWSEVNFEKEYLNIPASKMKTNKEFILPLSKQAIEILRSIKSYSYEKSKFVFPSPTSNLKPLSDATLNHALTKLGYKDKITSHGFRAMFSTIAHEKVKEHGFHSDIIESCLAHAETNKIKAAYNRESKMKYYDEKKELMQWWADWLDK